VFFATLTVIVSTMPIVDAARLIPQQAVDERFGPLGSDKGNKRPDPEIVGGAVHVLAARERVTFPTPLQISFDATAPLIAYVTSGTQAGAILAEITFCSQMTPTAHQTTIRDTVYERLFVHLVCFLVTTKHVAARSVRASHPHQPGFLGIGKLVRAIRTVCLCCQYNRRPISRPGPN
jgi:hypothetical protein